MPQRRIAVSAAVVVAVVAILALLGRADEPERRPLGSSLDINIGTPTATATPTATPTPTPTATPTPGVANVWIVPSGGGCSARASSPVTLAAATTAQKCDTADGWEAAFLLANCGDTVLIDSGSYGSQTLDTGHSGTCATITLAAGPDETVESLDTLIDGASNLRIAGKGWDNQNPDFGDLIAGGPNPNVASPEIRSGTNVGFDGIDFLHTGAANGATNGYIINSDIGPYLEPSCPGSGMPIANGATLTNFTFSGNYIHTIKFLSCSPPNDHMDCIHWYSHTAGTTLIADNVIEDCINYGFLIESSSNMTIRNNWLGDTAFCGIGFHGDSGSPDSFSNVTVEFNSGIGCISPQVNNSWTGSVFRGNAVTNVGGNCRTGITYSYNKQSNGSPAATTCGTGDAISQTLTFTSTTAGALNFHILSGNPLKDAGGATCTAADYDGDSRPAGAACDVGSDEVG